jgi:hypothetical protein
MSTMPSNEQAPDSRSQLLSHIHLATKAHDNVAKGLRKRRWWIGCSLIVLGPLAVLVLTYHYVWDVWGRQGMVLDGVEFALLLMALVAGFWRLGGSQHEKWIRERLCTEILRRESFLFVAGVGPYLDPGVLSIRVEDRIKTIGSSAKDLVELVPMVTERGD